MIRCLTNVPPIRRLRTLSVTTPCCWSSRHKWSPSRSSPINHTRVTSLPEACGIGGGVRRPARRIDATAHGDNWDGRFATQALGVHPCLMRSHRLYGVLGFGNIGTKLLSLSDAEALLIGRMSTRSSSDPSMAIKGPTHCSLRAVRVGEPSSSSVSSLMLTV